MRVSQFIYTSYKNGDSTVNKGFQVYAKSADISVAESDEIHTMMAYKAPADLPYAPTKREIEELFPRNFAYFKLSSGRACLAKSKYIGQDYTNRWGNYIIHAFVFDQTDKIIPANFNSTYFRESLTDEEQNSPAPESLPQIDIESGEAIGGEQVAELLSRSGNLQLFQNLMASVIGSINEEASVNFYTDYESAELWIKILSMALPRSFLKDFSFRTFSSDSSNKFILSCIWGKKGMDPTELGFSLNKVYHISAYGESPSEDLRISRYIEYVSNHFSSDYYGTILYIAEIDKILTLEKIDLDLADKILSLKNGNMFSFNWDEVEKVLSVASKSDENERTNILNRLVLSMSTDDEKRGDEKTIALYRKIYSQLSEEYKKAVLRECLDLYCNRYSKSDDFTRLYGSLKSDCPCSWEEATRFFLSESNYNAFIQSGDLPLVYFIAAILCDAYGSLSVSGKSNAEMRLKSILSSALIKSEFQLIKGVFLCLKKTDVALYEKVYQNLAMENTKVLVATPEALFRYLTIAPSARNLWHVLSAMLQNDAENREFYWITYLKLVRSDSAFKNALGKEAQQDEYLKDFMRTAELFAQCKESPRTKEEIVDKYRQLSRSRLDDEIFHEFSSLLSRNTIDFISAFKESQQFDVCKYVYEKLFENEPIQESGRDVFVFTVKKMFEGRNIKFLSKNLKVKQANEILMKCQAENVEINGCVTLYCEGEALSDLAQSKQFSMPFPELLRSKFTFYRKKFSQDLGNEFLSMYLNVPVEVFIRNYSDNFLPLVEEFILPLSAYSNFEKELTGIFDLPDEVSLKIAAKFFDYILSVSCPFATVIRSVLERYLKKLGGKREKFFSEILQLVQHQTEMNAYITDYEKQNESKFSKFIGKIFGKKKES